MAYGIYKNLNFLTFEEIFLLMTFKIFFVIKQRPTNESFRNYKIFSYSATRQNYTDIYR